MMAYTLPSTFLNISEPSQLSDPDHEPKHSTKNTRVNIARHKYPYFAGMGYMNPVFTGDDTSTATAESRSAHSTTALHQVPQYGYKYEDWNWSCIRITCTAVTIAVIVGLFSTVIGLVAVQSRVCNPTFQWWQGTTIYRANPKTFNDKDEDGHGDLTGMTERLEYVKEFGAGVIMMTNVLDCVDDGAECLSRDHHKIRSMYGDYEQLLAMSTEAHRLGLHVIASIPAGYTSTEHSWFQSSRRQAKKSSDRFTDYYVWLDEPDPEIPSALDSVRSQYYLYYGDVNRPLLNWNNSMLREDVEQSMIRLLRCGVHGFYLENFDKVPLIDEETLRLTMRHLREAADHYDNPVAHSDDLEGHYPRDRCLMVPHGVLKMIANETEETQEKLYKYIDLIDIEIKPSGVNLTSSLIEQLNEKKIQSQHEYHPWPCWRLGVTSEWPHLHAGMLIQTMTYPGTVCLDAGAEIGETDVTRMDIIQWNTGSLNMHWMPYSPTRSLDESLNTIDAVLEVVLARRRSLAIRSNGAVFADEFDDGYRVPYHQDHVLVFVRDYLRARNYLTIVNYGKETIELDLSHILVKSEILMNSDRDGIRGWTKWDKFTLKSGQVILARQTKWSL